MPSATLNYSILAGFFVLFQAVLGVWCYAKTRSSGLAVLTFLACPVGLPMTFYRLRENIKDNQIGGGVTYVSVIAGIIIFLVKLPADETPWFVIFTMEFFAGLGVVNIINLALSFGPSDGNESAR